MISVITVDDHPVVRRGLKQIIAAEQDMQVVGEALCISGKTVSSYRARILEKMNMSNNSDLTRYALEHHLI